MPDRFDLENAITQFHSIADDISLVVENILENDIDQDDIVNALVGIEVLLKLRTQKTFDIFAAVFKLDGYRDTRDTISDA